MAQYDIIKDVTEKNDSAQKLLNYSQCAKGEEGDAYCNTWLTKMVLGCFNKNTIIMFTALFLYYRGLRFGLYMQVLKPLLTILVKLQ